MASTWRTQGKNQAPEIDTEELLSTLSQQSGGSDDLLTSTRAKLEEQMKASSEKKRRGREKNFLLAAEKELQQILTSSVDDGLVIIRSMDENFAKFTLDYAVSEDVIRKLWCRVRDEQKAFQNLVDEHRKSHVKSVEDTEAGQIEGMALARGSCEDHKAIITSLDPSSIRKDR